ncbi:MAG: hypothetical protein ABJQ71_13620 [Roseibium sp.]
MRIPVKKVIKEKRKAFCKVLGILKVGEKSTTMTTITTETSLPMIIEADAQHLPDDIVEDVTFDQIEDLDEA